MKTYLRVSVVALASFWALQIQAMFLLPTTPGVIPGAPHGAENCEPACLETVFAAENLTLLYEAEPAKGGRDSAREVGAYAASYGIQFLDTATDPSGATITYLGGPAIACGECFLAIEDGKAASGYYFFDLSGWNGTEAITLSNFWPSKGAITHVAIWRERVAVPEPGALALLGAGLLLAGFLSRKKFFS